jgi:hypothetical protein
MRAVDGVIAIVTGVVVVDAAVTASYLSIAYSVVVGLLRRRALVVVSTTLLLY